jgi:hypothetical protein
VLVYQVFRSISYADGTDNSLVSRCLDSTFQIWMVTYLQLNSLIFFTEFILVSIANISEIAHLHQEDGFEGIA